MTKDATTAKEIDAKIKELSEKLRKTRFALAGSRPKNVKEEREIKREIARLETAKRAQK